MPNPETHTCPDCGYVWKHGEHGGHSCAVLLKARVAEQDRLLIRCRRELQSVLADINAEQVPHDGDDFHELLRDLNEALTPKP